MSRSESSSAGQAASSTSSSSSRSDVQSTLEAALAVYSRTTGIDLSTNRFATESRIGQAGSSDDILQLFQERVHRNDNQRLTSTLNPAVSVLHALSGNLGGAVDTVRFPPASVIFAGIDNLLATASWTSSYNNLIELFERLGNYLKRLEIYTMIPPFSLMTELIVKIIVELLSVLALATKKYKEGRLMKFIKKFSEEREIEDALQRLDRLTQEDVRTAVAQTLGVVHGLVDDVRGLMEESETSMDSIRQDLDILRNEKDNMKDVQLRRDVQHWLAPPNPSTNHDAFWRARRQGTAAWLFENEVLIKWKTTGSLLWIHGIPGSGKSTLLSAIVEDIRGKCAAGLASMAYYYFDFHDVKKQDCYGLLSSLLFQLSAESNAYHVVLSRLYEDNAAGIEKPTYSALLKCLKDMLSLSRHTPVFIIVDALDECPNFPERPSAREEVLELVEELVRSRLPGLHLCVASRPEIDIRMVLGPLTDLQISLHDETGQKRDINDYIETVVHSDRRMGEWREEDQNLVVKRLSKNADGSFRWVVCQVGTLCHSFPRNIRSVLAGLPPSLDETYEKTLLGINKEKREFALQVYQCLVVSIRPLLVEELAEILAIRFDEVVSPVFNAAWRPENAEEAVMSACSSLIAVIDGGSRGGDRHQVVRFSHFSVKEYLTSERLSTAEERLSYYHILPEPAHTILAQASLSVLLQLDGNTIHNSPLARYAAQHWVYHAQFGDVSLHVHVKELMERLFDPAMPYFVAWVRLYDIDRDWMEPMSEEHLTRPEAVPLYYASLCGFHGLVEYLLVAHPQDVNARGGHHVTSLHAALDKGHVKVARLLLEHGAEVNARDSEYLTPLHLAAESGDNEVIQLLIDHGADTNAEDFDLSIPLSLASRRGRLEAAQLLLKHGAHVDHRDFFSQTPMHEALDNGHAAHADIVRLLLDRGADPNAQGRSRRTPLHLAAERGELAVSRLLIERGAKVDPQDEMDWTPLHFASEHGDTELLRFLIDHGANRDARSKTQETPLFLASREGKLEAARLLLGCGADINSRVSLGDAPLHVAAENGHYDVVRLLLDHGANANAQGRSLRTPLHLAAGRGKLAISRLLIERGAELDPRDEMNRIPLHFASEHGDLEILRFLIGRGANPDARSKDQETPLLLASRKGKLEAAQLLLKHGTDVDSQDLLGCTPLHVAAENKHCDIVRLLLNRGADVHAQEKKLRTPLHLAADRGALVVSQILIEHHAELDPRDEMDRTPLHFASEYGDPEILRYLISHGADPNARSKDQETPLLLASRRGKLEAARLLLEHSTDINSQDSLGRTPLHVAAENGHSGIVRLLLDQSADVHARENKLRTPLHLAADRGELVVLQMLIEHGAELNPRDKMDWTPLHFASEHGDPEVLRYLINHGANPDARNKDQETPLLLASRKGKLEAARLLSEHGSTDINSQDLPGRVATQNVVDLHNPRAPVEGAEGTRPRPP